MGKEGTRGTEGYGRNTKGCKGVTMGTMGYGGVCRIAMGVAIGKTVLEA